MGDVEGETNSEAFFMIVEQIPANFEGTSPTSIDDYFSII
jgi:hypothetical protein